MLHCHISVKVLKLIKDTGKSKMGSKINDRGPSKILQQELTDDVGEAM